MEHLTPDALARLVDEPPTGAEAAHLAECPRCAAELDALQEQTEALGHLADLRPPQGAWEPLAARLRAEGLLRPEAERPRTGAPWWSRGPVMQAAAALSLFLVGGAAGFGIGLLPGSEATPTGVAGEDAPAEAHPIARLASMDPENAFPDELTVDQAAELVRVTEAWYMEALIRYRDRIDREAPVPETDPLGRWAALETLMAAGQAAVHQSPTDPFLNGILANMQAEREATLRGMEARTVGQNWY
jgi:hypothetical protein